MAITKSKAKTAKKTTRKSAITRNRRPQASKQPSQAQRSTTAPASKQDAVLTLLRAPKGTDIPTMMKATGWQAHSVRGFLAGTVKSKLKLRLISEKLDGRRIYRIAKAAGER